MKRSTSSLHSFSDLKTIEKLVKTLTSPYGLYVSYFWGFWKGLCWIEQIYIQSSQYGNYSFMPQTTDYGDESFFAQTAYRFWTEASTLVSLTRFVNADEKYFDCCMRQICFYIVILGHFPLPAIFLAAESLERLRNLTNKYSS